MLDNYQINLQNANEEKIQYFHLSPAKKRLEFILYDFCITLFK